MKEFLINNHGILEGIIAMLFMASFLLLLFVSYIFNKDAYEKIAGLYEKKFGKLPYNARICRHASLIATPYLYHNKVGFIMGSLMLPYNRVTNHGMSKEEYYSIRTLPRNLTTSFKVEFILWILGPLFLGLFALIEWVVPNFN